MADVEITYNNNKIVELSESGIKTLKTAGKYCEDDIVLEYVKPAASSTYIVISSIEGATLTCGSRTYTLGAGETMHAFDVEAGTYTCTASKTDYRNASDDVSVVSGFEYVTLIPLFLPTTYQQVEYLYANTNGQYIDTGLVPDTTYRWELDIKYGTFSSNISYQNGVSQQAQADRFTIAALDTNTANLTMGEGQNMTCNTTARHLYAIDIPNNTMSIDDSVYSFQSTYTKSANYHLLLFWRNSAGSKYSNQHVTGWIYSSKIYAGGTLIQYLVPCYRKSDLVIGMYDKVSGTFFTNAGSGTFVIGPNV